MAAAFLIINHSLNCKLSIVYRITTPDPTNLTRYLSIL